MKPERKPVLTIEIDAENTSLFLSTGDELTPEHEAWDDVADCATTGDCVAACEYLITGYVIDFRIVADDGQGYVNRLATDAELQTVCESIYFESETDFSDRDNCELYATWNAAGNVIDNRHETDQ